MRVEEIRKEVAEIQSEVSRLEGLDFLKSEDALALMTARENEKLMKSRLEEAEEAEAEEAWDRKVEKMAAAYDRSLDQYKTGQHNAEQAAWDFVHKVKSAHALRNEVKLAKDMLKGVDGVSRTIPEPVFLRELSAFNRNPQPNQQRLQDALRSLGGEW